MMSDSSRSIIEQYIAAYNAFHIEDMLALLHDEVVFQNYAGGKLELETSGISEFRELAEQSAKMFESRCQSITDFRSTNGQIVVDIQYEAVLAVDLPNGMKRGEQLQLTGKSVFQIQNGKISRIEDHS
ncbi:nuclear transport factor 2 family protein [Paenibacillus sp. 1011MAR3C5]|uniref:nuclear transport factor 2 family protein n=1 Tax=Paenibacillus sp. 1011MAR3C5 TaxID=1675787 RepID=UPI000E6BF7EA|nr:nuclear transport factor 2 family protein [Paenibacillus sp. 1011MAR3C5]RJE88383.1 nuclear transport factor 2 family protein [Paenibacillus sp. 1011MAR3C5]